MVNISFDFAGTPKIIFENEGFEKLPELIAEYGERVLIITGGSFLRESGYFDKLVDTLSRYNVSTYDESVKEEPSPDLVDNIADKYRNKNIDIVAAVGGGSVMDTGKAVSAMLTTSDSVMKYLEGVGAGKEHSGEKIPMIAVPTTSGTGSEATKNAVLSRVGEDGFKKSLRHDNFIPDIALLDPELTVSCPSEITAASGLDAITQLLGAYVSSEASVLTDSLAFRALKIAGSSLIPVCTDEADNLQLRANMAYASLISGVVLANAGLGIVHGLASPIGGFYDIPHGVVCGTVFGEAVNRTINLLKDKKGDKFLEKYAQVGAHWAGKEDLYYQEKNIDKCCQLLINTIEKWLNKLQIPRLSEYGIEKKDLDKIARNTGNKNNPVKLDKNEIKQLLKARL